MEEFNEIGCPGKKHTISKDEYNTLKECFDAYTDRWLIKSLRKIGICVDYDDHITLPPNFIISLNELMNIANNISSQESVSLDQAIIKAFTKTDKSFRDDIITYMEKDLWNYQDESVTNYSVAKWIKSVYKENKEN